MMTPKKKESGLLKEQSKILFMYQWRREEKTVGEASWLNGIGYQRQRNNGVTRSAAKWRGGGLAQRKRRKAKTS